MSTTIKSESNLVSQVSTSHFLLGWPSTTGYWADEDDVEKVAEDGADNNRQVNQRQSRARMRQRWNSESQTHSRRQEVLHTQSDFNCKRPKIFLLGARAEPEEW